MEGYHNRSWFHSELIRRHDFVAAAHRDGHYGRTGFNRHDKGTFLERPKLARPSACTFGIDQERMPLLQLAYCFLHAADGMNTIFPVDEDEAAHLHDEPEQGQFSQLLFQNEAHVQGDARKQGWRITVALVIG